MSQPERDGDEFPGARLLLDQLIRLNDYQIESVNHLLQKSRAYLSVGALAVAAGIALLAIPDAEGALHLGVIAGASLALSLFGVSALLAVRAERATRRLPDAPHMASLASLVLDREQTDAQLMLWIAREFLDHVVPSADRAVDQVARLVDWQLRFFLAEVVALGGTLIAALLT